MARLKWGIRLVAGALAAALALCAAACNGDTAKKEPSSSVSQPPAESLPEEPADPNWPCTVAGVTLEEAPQGVVSLNPSVTEILFDMGLGGKLAGVGEFDRYPPQAQDLPPMGSEILPDTAAIIASGAQVVLTVGALPQTAAESLADEGVAMIRLEKPGDVESLPDYWAQIAAAVLGAQDGPEAAQSFAQPLLRAYEAIRGQAPEGESRPGGVFAAMLPLTLATGDSLQGRLLEACGVANLAGEYTDWQYPQELLLPLDPQVLVADERTCTLDEVRAHPNYQTTACVVQNRLLQVDGAAIENGGKRLFQAMLDIALLANPDASLPQTVEELAAQLGEGGAEE